MNSKRSLWYLVAGLLILSLLAAGCSTPAEEPEPTQTPAAEEVATEAPVVEEPTEAPVVEEPTEEPPTEEPAEPNVFVFAANNDFADLDPAISFSDDNIVTSQCYETLTYYNLPGSDEAVSPLLATSWESSEDAMEWTFHIREGVTFHNGDPLNAQAVKDAIDNTIAVGLGASYIWWPVAEISVVDEYTVKFTLTYPAPLDLIAASGYAAWIYNTNVYKEKGTEWLNEGNCIGTGPYTIESYEGRQRVVMNRFDDYWRGWGEDQFDNVVIEIAFDPTVRQQMIESGTADFVQNIPLDNYAALEADPDIVHYSSPSFSNVFAWVNTVAPPLDNKLVREALQYSFPWDDVLDVVYKDTGTKAYGPVPIGMWGSSTDLFQYYHDPEKAADLLAQAGYPDGGFDLLLTYITGSLDDQQMGEVWKAELAKLGINMELQGLTWEAQSQLGQSGPYDVQHIFQGTWWPDWITPYGFLFYPFHCEEVPLYNFSYYCNPEFDELIDTADWLSGTDPETATDMFIQAQEILIDDAAGIFMQDVLYDVFVGSDIQGYVDNPAYHQVTFAYQLTRE